MLLKLISTVKGKWFLVLGLGRAGRAVVNALLRANALVWGYDDNELVWDTQAVISLYQQGLKRFVPNGSNVIHSPSSRSWDGVIASPGFPSRHRLIRFFRKVGTPIVDELDFASQFLPGQLIAITGTNGKSTTTALIAAMLKKNGQKVFLGGNLLPGRPLSAALLSCPQDYYVVEVSSFQLERSRSLAPKVAVLLNITPDHIDRHSTFDNYVQAKAKIFRHQTAEDWAVVNKDDAVIRQLVNRIRANIIFFSQKQRINGGYILRRYFWFGDEVIAPISIVNYLPAVALHRFPVIENALAAICVARLCGVRVQAIRQALKKFRGLEHRLELVRRCQGVYYINNSMCTNPAAGVRSLEAFKKKVILICGGKEKDVPETPYVKAMSQRAKWVVLLGENSGRLAQSLDEMDYQRYDIADSMVKAVRLANVRAKAGDIVLFSPGFASFDMFRDFRQRGKAFKHEVERL